MNILVINCGSSSFKYQLLDMKREFLLASGLVERIGQESGKLNHKKYKEDGSAEKLEKTEKFADHTVALNQVLALLTSKDWGVIGDIGEIGAVGHRVVQGGELLQKACVVGDKEKDVIRKLFEIAPLHNPANLQGIEVAQSLCPNAPSVAVFDTEFYSTMPPESYRYALPKELYTELGIRRYGFHGTSHRYVSNEAAKFLGRPLKDLKMITCHLGNGCSMTAIQDGAAIDTSMGFTPLAGLVMGTRCGDIDPAITTYLGNAKGMDLNELDAVFNKKSGMLGLCGMSDMRDIHAAVEKGDADAELAVNMFCKRVKQYIGGYMAIMGGLDVLVFTAGIGENDDIARAGSVAGMEGLGISIVPELNAVRSSEPRRISPEGSPVTVLVVPTNEELEIARTTLSVLQQA